MAESTITREMIEAGARAYDLDTLRKAGWTGSAIAKMMEGREPSPISFEASELILRAALATGADR